jgi:hypothetical protein
MLVLPTRLLPFILCISALMPQSVEGEPPLSGDPAPAARTADDEGAAETGIASNKDAAVRELLLAARRYQRGDRPLPRPSSLHGRFYVSLRQDDGSKFVANVERWYTRQPQRLLTTSTERVTGSTTTVAWTEDTAWFRDDKAGEVVIYSDAPDLYEVDLELLRQQLELTQLLLDASVLDSLVPRLVGAHLSGTRTITAPQNEQHDVSLITARISDPVYAQAIGATLPAEGEPPLVLELELGIEASTGVLWEMRVRSPGRADLAPMRMTFAFHGHTRSGLRVPGNIKLFRADEPLARISLGVDTDDDDYLVFDVDMPIDVERFSVPAPR